MKQIQRVCDPKFGVVSQVHLARPKWVRGNFLLRQIISVHFTCVNLL